MKYSAYFKDKNFELPPPPSNVKYNKTEVVGGGEGVSPYSPQQA